MNLAFEHRPINDGTEMEITGCSAEGEVTIPPEIDGKPVTSIGVAAFMESLGLTSITIPKGVTSIGNNAFYRCRGLTSITLPKGVTFILRDEMPRTATGKIRHRILRRQMRKRLGIN